MIDSGPFIRSLQDRIAELEEENASLKDALGALDGCEDAHRLGLTKSEGRIYRALTRRKVATTDQLIFALYPNDPDRRAERDPSIIRVHIRNMRRKGIPIAVSRAVGWWLDKRAAE
jgi:DNA-binding response OmpR family regulator